MEPQRSDAQPRWLTRYLADQDVPCPCCRYNLRGLQTDRCPECAEHLTLTVGLTEPRHASYLAAAVSLGAGIGFNGLILGYAAIDHLQGGGPGLGDIFPLLVGLVTEGLGLAALVRWRRWFRALGALDRWLLVAGCAAATVVFAVWFFARML